MLINLIVNLTKDYKLHCSSLKKFTFYPLLFETICDFYLQGYPAAITNLTSTAGAVRRCEIQISYNSTKLK